MNPTFNSNIGSFISGKNSTLSGHFETNGFVAKFQSNGLEVELCGNRVKINYEQGVVSINDIDALVKHISSIMEIMQHTNQEKE